MIYTLQIDKTEPGHYWAKVRHGREEIAEFGSASIGQAIRQCVAGPTPGITAFHIWYEHVCAGTTPVSNMRYDPETIAQRLMVLHGHAS